MQSRYEIDEARLRLAWRWCCTGTLAGVAFAGAAALATLAGYAAGGAPTFYQNAQLAWTQTLWWLINTLMSGIAQGAIIGMVAGATALWKRPDYQLVAAMLIGWITWGAHYEHHVIGALARKDLAQCGALVGWLTALLVRHRWPRQVDDWYVEFRRKMEEQSLQAQ